MGKVKDGWGFQGYLRTETALLPRTRHSDLLDQDSAERIRHREVSRTLKKLDLSSEEEEAIERLSYSLVAGLLLGPISEITLRTKIRTSHKERGVDRAQNPNDGPKQLRRKCGPATTSKRDGGAEPR